MGRPTADRSRLATILIVTVAVGLFWGLAWRQMNDTILTQVPILDEVLYLRAAHTLVDEHWSPAQPYYMSPLYTWLVALTGSDRELSDSGLLIGASPWGIRILQMLLWLGVAWMLSRGGRRLFGPRWGWAPPLLWCFYLPSAVLASQVLMEVPLTFCATVALSLACGWVGPASTMRRALLAGVFVGAATLMRGTSVVLLVPVIFAFLFDGTALSRGSRRRMIAAVLLALLLVLLPALIHNSIKTNGLRGPSLNGGVNLYVGNWSGANGFFFAFSGFDVERDPGGAEYLSAQTGETIEGLAAADARWMSLAREEMLANPGRIFGLWAKKIWLHLVGIEIPQISSLSTWTRQVSIFRILLVPYGLLVVGALGGAVLGWRRRSELRPWMIALVVLIAAQSFFFVTTRYRLVLVPGMVLLATGLVRELAGLRGRALMTGLLVVVAATLAVQPWGLGRTRELFALSGLDNEAIRWFHVAEDAVDLDSGSAREAMDHAESLQMQSLAADSTRSQPWQVLARLRWLQDDRGLAMNLLKEGLGQAPEGEEMMDLLIRMQLEDERYAEAIPYLDAALRTRPNDLELLHLTVVATVRGSRGRAEREADNILHMGEAAARHAVSVASDRPEGFYDLGLMLANLGKYHEALEFLDRGLDLAVPESEIHRNLVGLREGVLSQLDGNRDGGENPPQD